MVSRPARLVIIEPVDVVQRFRAIDETLARYPELSPVTVLFEGALPSLWQPADPDPARPAGATGKRVVLVHNLGFGCPCCIGSLPLSVTMTRVLRQEKPQLIILAPLAGAHMGTLSQFLAEKFSFHIEIDAN